MRKYFMLYTHDFVLHAFLGDVMTEFKHCERSTAADLQGLGGPRVENSLNRHGGKQPVVQPQKLTGSVCSHRADEPLLSHPMAMNECSVYLVKVLMRACALTPTKSFAWSTEHAATATVCTSIDRSVDLCM
mmetsp:Transcript_15889/g.32235  ORF Transcript_15889/g.32235 Transcript_15889/m.32235 type:complete len:131 (+) Transcript_15889:1882-2274(+)